MNLTVNVTSIGDLAFGECWTEGQSDLIITTTEGSYADTFAQEHNIPVQYEGEISEFEYTMITTEWGDEIVITGYKFLADRVVIPGYIDGVRVTAVSGGAFKNCTNMTKVVLPESLGEIKEEAFAGCTGLTTITVPTWVWGIQSRAFAGCTGLTVVNIPENVSWMATDAFAECDLTKLVIMTKSEVAIAAAKVAGITCIDLRE